MLILYLLTYRTNYLLHISSAYQIKCKRYWK